MTGVSSWGRKSLLARRTSHTGEEQVQSLRRIFVGIGTAVKVQMMRGATANSESGKRRRNLRIQLDRLHDARDRAVRTRLVRLQPATHGCEQPEQLSEHDVEDRTIIIRKIRTAQGKTVVREILHIAAIARGDNDSNASQTLAIDFAQQAELVSTTARFTR